MDGTGTTAHGGRWYERLYHGPDYDMWVISWLPGQSTGFHDHGASSGAFVVATGVLEEHRLGEHGARDLWRASLAPSALIMRMTCETFHAPAISIHAYSPPLDEMNEYELEGVDWSRESGRRGRLETLDEERESEQQSRTSGDRLSIEQMLAAARARLRRLSAAEAYEAVAERPGRCWSTFVLRASAR